MRVSPHFPQNQASLNSKISTRHHHHTALPEMALEYILTLSCPDRPSMSTPSLASWCNMISTSSIDWDRFPVKTQRHIHKLLLSLICYTLVGLLPQLIRESKSITSLVYIIILIITIKPASRQVPFQQIPGLFMLVSTLPLLLPVNIIALTNPMI